jgi:hypothetical protein
MASRVDANRQVGTDRYPGHEPRAKAELVNRFNDLVPAAETHQTQTSFLESLAFLDGESFARYRAAFMYPTLERQT